MILLLYIAFLLFRSFKHLQYVHYIQWQYFHFRSGFVVNLYGALLHIHNYSYFDEEIQSKEQIIDVSVHHKENHLTYDSSHLH